MGNLGRMGREHPRLWSAVHARAGHQRRRFRLPQHSRGYRHGYGLHIDVAWHSGGQPTSGRRPRRHILRLHPRGRTVLGRRHRRRHLSKSDPKGIEETSFAGAVGEPVQPGRDSSGWAYSGHGSWKSRKEGTRRGVCRFPQDDLCFYDGFEWSSLSFEPVRESVFAGAEA